MSLVERIGNSEVYILPKQKFDLGDGKEELWGRIRIPMPPSANARQKVGFAPLRGGRFGWRSPSGRVGVPVIMSTPAARDYLSWWPSVNLAWRKVRTSPYTSYVTMRFYFFLANPRYDTHNGLKLACDLLEKGSLVVDDKYILPHVMMPVVAKEEPRLIVEFPL